jgi:PleD family two-component response regulator
MIMKSPFKKLFGNLKSSDQPDCRWNHLTPCGHEQFLYLIEIERSRSHRHNMEFSLILIKIDQNEIGEAVVSQLVQKISKRIRRIDKIGWYGKGQIGILLPITNHLGAKKFADDLERETQGIRLNIEFSTISYPTKK